MQIDPISGRWTSQGPQPPVPALRVLAAGPFHPPDAVTSPEQSPAEDLLGDVLDLLCQKDLSVVAVDGGAGDDPARTARAACEGQFDLASLAGSVQLGPGRLAATIESLQSEGIEVLGAGLQPTQARRPLVIEVAGMRVGLLSMGPDGLTASDRTIRNVLDPARAVLQIRDLHGRCDLVVALAHRQPVELALPSPQTVRLYRCFVEAGADAVIGLGGPAPGPLELYESRPIVYNLPALWPGRVDYQAAAESMSVRLEFRAGRLAQLQVIPLAIDSARGRLGILQDAVRRAFLARLNDMSKVLGDAAWHDRLWNAWCLRQLDQTGRDVVQSVQAASREDQSAASRGLELLGAGPRIEAIRRGLELVADGQQADRDAESQLDAWRIRPRSGSQRA